MAEYQLKINGKTHKMDVEPDTPLLWVLRDELDMNGTKYGCGMALCGACTVHINGNAARSCSIKIGMIDGAEVRTIEGLSDDQSHPVQKAWKEIDVPQCGYCQSGQMMTAAAFLEENHNPTTKEIRTAMSGNICRCATYNSIEKAIKKASESYK